MNPGLREEKRVLGLCLALSFCGFLALASAGEGSGFGSHLYRQIYWTGLGVLVFMGVRRLDTRHLLELARPTALFSGFMLFLVLLIGHDHAGSRRWFDIGLGQWTPSEFARWAFVLVIVRELGRGGEDVGGSVRALGWWAGCSILILSQPDLGRAGMLFPLLILLLWCGTAGRKLVAGLTAAAVLVLPLGYTFLKDYQQRRIQAFLHPELDTIGAGWNLVQSKIAIGSGGLWGTGWLRGTQTQYQFIPEKHTDFIFAVIGEEWGLLGCFLILTLAFSIMVLGIQYAREARDKGGALLAIGMTFLVVLEALVNMGMTVGLFPVSGLPLPLVSYGGSSVVVTYAAMAVVSRVGAEGSKSRRVQGLEL